AWGGAAVTVKLGSGTLAIAIEDPEHVGRGVAAVTVDGRPVDDGVIAAPAAGATRHVRVRLGRRHASAASI
ncbi:MAG: hypothetical protein D6782_04565, partial [Alphaproteobacteria bacterium]